MSYLDVKPIDVNLETSRIIDVEYFIDMMRHVGGANYHRYGSTIEFYVPDRYVERFVNNAKDDGLDVYI
jgi:hypothetical protein